MPAINLSISGRLYEVVCEDSQVEHVRDLAAQVDERAHRLVSEIGPQPEARLLLMIALTLADELAEKTSQGDRAQNDLGSTAAAEQVMAQTVTDLAARIESIAMRLERS